MDPVVVGAAPGAPIEKGTQTAVLAPARVFDPSSASLRITPRAPTFAIVVLLLFDAGLATAGALLMKAGLHSPATTPVPSDPPAPPPTTVPITAPPTATTTTTTTATNTNTATATTTATNTATTTEPTHATHPSATDHPSSSGSGSGSNPQTVDGYVSDLFGKHPDAGVPVAIPPHPDAAPVLPTSSPPDAAPPPPDAASASDPVDPYASPPPPPDAAAAPGDDDPHTVDLAAEVEHHSAQSQSRFTHCYEDSAKAYTPDQPLAGEVDIAFRVMPTGEVQNAAAVKNTTGSDKLADCLASVISGWTFAPSNLAEPAVFVRPFRFDGH